MPAPSHAPAPSGPAPSVAGQANWWGRVKNLLSLPRRERLPVAATPADIAWQDNKLQLLRYRQRPQGLAHPIPVLLVPSLINRHYVLDLTPGKSFVEFMVQRGFDVYCIDWGAPTAEDRYITFDDIVDRMVGRALRKVCQLSAQPQAHVLGYCMGGTLAAIHAAAHPERFASLTAVAAPVAFDRAGPMAEWLRSGHFDVDALVRANGVVPSTLLQSSFQLLRPTLPLAKAVNLIDRAWNDKFLDGYLAMETWANDNVGLPGEFYRTYVRDLYQHDQLRSGTFALSGQRVQLSAVCCPVLTVAFTVDSIAPQECCTPLANLVGSVRVQRVLFDGSHVGGMTSGPAAKGLWPQIAAFWSSIPSA